MTYHPFDWRLNDLTGRARSNKWICSSPTSRAIVTGSSRGSAWQRPISLIAEGCRVSLRAWGPSGGGGGGGSRSRRSTPDLIATVGGRRRPRRALVVEPAVRAVGGLDILVNNVGRAAGTDLLDTTDAEWQAAFDETLFPAIRASRLAFPHMKRRGGGAIVMIASIWGRESGGRMTYNAVKAAEISLAKSLAQQLAPLNIRVNSVAPGSILFPGGSWHKRQQADPQGIAEFIKRDLPFGRMGRGDEVGTVVAFLASPRASWVSGASITVDGCQSRSNI